MGTLEGRSSPEPAEDVGRIRSGDGFDDQERRPLEADQFERSERELSDGTDVGYRDRPLTEFRSEYPDEYIEPWSRTVPTESFVDPELTVRDVNPERRSGAPYEVNCADSARAFERTWRGDREEAAGRADTRHHEGGSAPEGELDDRTEAWAGRPFEPVADVEDVRRRVADGGHGSSAIVHTEFTDHDGFAGGHAFNVVNHHGEVRVVEAQGGMVHEWAPGTGHPDMATVRHTRAMGWDGRGRPLW